ncbi:MAG: endonuclease/exonuclease/phosphatase family protein [Sciscionella sp.]
MHRRVLLLAALFCGSTAFSPATAAAAQPTTLRVMSYNIHAGLSSAGTLNLDGTAREIENSGADVVGLEEVDVHWDARSAYVDEAHALAEKLDMRVFFAPIYDAPAAIPGAPRRRSAWRS